MTVAKIREIASACQELNADLVIFVNTLTPQQREVISAMLDRPAVCRDDVMPIQQPSTRADENPGAPRHPHNLLTNTTDQAADAHQGVRPDEPQVVPGISPRLLRRIRADFPHHSDQVLAELIRIRNGLARHDEEIDPVGHERILAAIVLLTKGDLRRLAAAVALATTDWRDLLVAAGLAHDNWPTLLDT